MGSVPPSVRGRCSASRRMYRIRGVDTRFCRNCAPVPAPGPSRVAGFAQVMCQRRTEVQLSRTGEAFCRHADTNGPLRRPQYLERLPSGGTKPVDGYPGWYQGRATHIHVEVVRSGSSVKVTQIAFPESTGAAVYAIGVYAARGSNPISNTQDDAFADSPASEFGHCVGRFVVG